MSIIKFEFDACCSICCIRHKVFNFLYFWIVFVVVNFTEFTAVIKIGNFNLDPW